MISVVIVVLSSLCWASSVVDAALVEASNSVIVLLSVVEVDVETLDFVVVVIIVEISGVVAISVVELVFCDFVVVAINEVLEDSAVV